MIEVIDVYDSIQKLAREKAEAKAKQNNKSQRS